MPFQHTRQAEYPSVNQQYSSCAPLPPDFQFPFPTSFHLINNSYISYFLINIPSRGHRSHSMHAHNIYIHAPTRSHRQSRAHTSSCHSPNAYRPNPPSCCCCRRRNNSSYAAVLRAELLLLLTAIL